jgi:hypothetical protein
MSDTLIWVGNAMMIVGVVLLVGLVGLHVWLRHFNDRLEQALVELVEQMEDQMIGLEIVIDNNVYLCYNSRDKQFICQGTNAREIIDRFQVRYPNKIAYIAGDAQDPAVKELVEQLIKLKDETSHSQ